VDLNDLEADPLARDVEFVTAHDKPDTSYALVGGKAVTMSDRGIRMKIVRTIARRPRSWDHT
jgi:hypothetical protein